MSSPWEVLTVRTNELARRRLRQLVREELSRTDLKALVHEVIEGMDLTALVQAALHEQSNMTSASSSNGPVQQRVLH